MPRTVTFSQNERVTAAKLEAALDETYNSSGVEIPLTVDAGGTGGTTQAAARLGLGLGSIATQNANAVAITGGTWNGGTIGATTKPSSVSSSRFDSSSTGAQTQVAHSGADSVSQSGLYLRHRWTGTSTGSDSASINTVGPYKFLFTDVCNASPSSDEMCALMVGHTVSANTAGTDEPPRIAINGRMAVRGQMGASGYVSFVPLSGIADSTVNMGGVGGWTTADPPDSFFRGGLFGGNFNARLTVDSTYWRGLTGVEINWGALIGTSVFEKCGLSLVKSDADAVNGIGGDQAIRISAQSTSAPIGTGIQFGAVAGNWPFGTASKLIAIQRRGYGISGISSPEASVTAGYGIDFTLGTFSQAAIATPGFTVDPDGDVIAKSVTLGTGGPVWLSGTGTPEGAVTAPVGSLFSRTDGGTGTTLYVKESGTGNTGWVAK